MFLQVIAIDDRAYEAEKSARSFSKTLTFPGGCLCGSDTCRGSITGWKDLSDERKAAYRGLVAPYLVEIDRETAAP